MKTPQNVLKMSTVSPDTSRETATPLTDGCNNNRMSSFLHSTNSLCFSATRLQNVIKTRRALGRAHVPPTKVFLRLAVNKTSLKPRLAAATGSQYLYVGFSRRNKIMRFQRIRYRRKKSGSGIRTIIRIGLKS